MRTGDSGRGHRLTAARGVETSQEHMTDDMHARPCLYSSRPAEVTSVRSEAAESVQKAPRSGARLRAACVHEIVQEGLSSTAGGKGAPLTSGCGI